VTIPKILCERTLIFKVTYRLTLPTKYVYLYLYKRDCLYQSTYVPLSQANCRTNPPKFCTDLPTNSGKVPNTSMTPLMQPPETPKPKQITWEKTFFYQTCPEGWLNLIEFFPCRAGARLASIHINVDIAFKDLSIFIILSINLSIHTWFPNAIDQWSFCINTSINRLVCLTV